MQGNFDNAPAPKVKDVPIHVHKDDFENMADNL
jgi:hypothetical protein